MSSSTYELTPQATELGLALQTVACWVLTVREPAPCLEPCRKNEPHGTSQYTGEGLVVLVNSKSGETQWMGEC